MIKKRLKILLAHSYDADPIIWGMGEIVKTWLIEVAKSYDQFGKQGRSLDNYILPTP